MTQENIENARRIPEQFFRNINKENVRKSIEVALSTSLLSRQFSQVEVLISQTEQRFHLFGNLLGAELSYDSCLTSSIIRLTYIAKMEWAPVKWDFYMYWAQDDWIVMSLDVSDDVKTWL